MISQRRFLRKENPAHAAESSEHLNTGLLLLKTEDMTIPNDLA